MEGTMGIIRMAVSAFIIALLAASVATPALAGAGLEIVTLSTRPDKVSGGDILTMVRVPPGTDLGAVSVRLNGVDVTAAFWQDSAAHALLGLVSGLRDGANNLEARAAGAGADRLRVHNHPLAGPVFSGPREQPFFCQTHQFRPYPNAPFLTASQITDPCMVPARVDYVYRTTGGAFAAYNLAAPPTNVAMTTTTEGLGLAQRLRQ
jgi:hypothetical protein